MKNKIPIYEANNNQILLIYLIYRVSEYKYFTDLVNTFTKRKIYKQDGTIDYSKYNTFEFDFQSIEEELAKMILTGKCLFEDEDHLNFVNYWGEGFNGGKSDLTDEEKKNINDYIKENYSYEKENELKKVYGNIQLLIFYLINNNCDENEEIAKLIEKLPGYINVKENNFKGIFENRTTLTIKKIISIFIFFEHLCFELFNMDIKEEYREDIDENIKNKITGNLLKEQNIKQLAASVRRFISRFLYKINNKDEFSPKGQLIIQLRRIDLWDGNLRKTEEIEKILELIKDYKLNVGQSLRFYELIKEKDEEEINTFSENNDRNNEVVNKKNKGKKKKVLIN